MYGFVKRLYLKVLKIYWAITVPIKLKSAGVKIGQKVIFYGMPIISKAQNSIIEICDGAVICSDSRFTDLGVNHPVVLRTLFNNSQIIIGKNTGISGASICSSISVEIGKECLLGANVTVIDTDFHALNPEGRRFNRKREDILTSAVVIEDNVFIGTNAIVLKGSSIGSGAIIAAGAIVSAQVPKNTIWGNQKSQLIRHLN